MNQLPVVAITMGDASGIGPEIIVKAMARPEIGTWARALVVGDAERLREAINITGAAVQVRAVESPEDARYQPGHIDCLDVPVVPAGHPFGVVSPVSGDGAFQFVKKAVELVLAGKAQAICTAPLNKEALHLGGHNFPGHTEMLQALAAEHAGVSVSDMPVRMMLANPDLRTVLNSIHVSLRQAIEAVTASQVEETLRITHDFLARTVARQAHRPPNIAVAGLNPHAGEGGLFGTEEQEAIIPAVARAQALGMHVHGPYPPDTVFMQAHAAAHAPIPFCDVVIAMYHDQGLIPVKYLGVEQGVNVTLGLPLVRTSPDHGTAFDLAGTARADAQSLLAALDMARMLSASDFSPAHGAGS